MIAFIALALMTFSMYPDAIDDALSTLQQQKPYLFQQATPSSHKPKQWSALANDAIIVGACAAIAHAYYTHYWRQASSQGFLGSMLQKGLPSFAYKASMHTSFILHTAEIMLKAYCVKVVSSWIIYWFVHESS